MPAGQRQVANGLFIDGEDGTGRAEFRRHVGNRGAIGERQALEAVAEEFHELIHHPHFAQHLGDGQHEIGGRGAGGQAAGQLEADHLRDQHGDRLAEHGGLGFDAPHPPTQHSQPIDHGGMRIGANQGIGVGEFLAGAVGRENDPRQMLDIHLMDDAGVGRHDLEITECGLAPAQEHVALAVALEFDFVVVLQRIGGPVFVDLHRVIDDQFGGCQRVDPLRISSQTHDGFAHGGQIHDTRDAGEVLHDDPRRGERNLMTRQRLRVPLQQRLDIVLGDVHAILEAQQVLQQNLQGEGQAADIERLERIEAQDFILLRAHLERRSCLEAIRHDPSAEK